MYRTIDMEAGTTRCSRWETISESRMSLFSLITLNKANNIIRICSSILMSRISVKAFSPVLSPTPFIQGDSTESTCTIKALNQVSKVIQIVKTNQLPLNYFGKILGQFWDLVDFFSYVKLLCSFLFIHKQNW